MEDFSWEKWNPEYKIYFWFTQFWVPTNIDSMLKTITSQSLEAILEIEIGLNMSNSIWKKHKESTF